MFHQVVNEFENRLVGEITNLGIVAPSKLWAKREQRQIVEEFQREPLRVDVVEHFGDTNGKCAAQFIQLRLRF